MKPRITASTEIFPIDGHFTIARGARTEIELIEVQVEGGGVTGRGEGSPIYYHGESAAGAVAIIDGYRGPLTRDALLTRMEAGAARNALDAALWDWEARLAGKPVWTLAGLAPPAPIATAITISIDTPAAMAEAAAEAAGRGHRLFKIKLGGEGDVDRIASVHEAVDGARLIVDANESWTGTNVAARAAELLPFGVELIEQPVARGEDHQLDGIVSPIPLCADESVQTRDDLARCIGRYQAINIKLDKAGGLTEALALRGAALAAGLQIMVGCMLSTSLGVAPGFLVAEGVDWVDLDGPLLLARDRAGGCRLRDGWLFPPYGMLWGG